LVVGRYFGVTDVRRWLVLLSIVCLIIVLLGTSFLSSRYVNSGASIFQLATLANQLGRPVVALIFTAVLIARFRDIWSRRVDIGEPVMSGIAKLAQGTGLALLIVFFLVLFLVLYLQFSIPTQQRAELPIFFIFGPMLTALPVGYFLFELGRLIDKDRHDSSA
jgi:cytochrome c biogenesis factor